MVATKTRAVCGECRRRTTDDDVVDLDRSSSSDVDRLRRLLAARDAATWNFDFRTSTALPGRYDWLRGSSADAVVETAVLVERGTISVRRGPRHSAARRRLVFDERDSTTADDAAATDFLLKRLIPPRSGQPDTAEVPGHSRLCSLGSVVSAALQASSDDRPHHQQNNACTVVHVHRSSSNVAVKRRRPAACEDRLSRVSAKITGKRDLHCN